MIPIYQTIATDTDGNCVAACLASILENNISDYPDLPNSKAWLSVLNKYLNSLGWNLLLMEYPDIQPQEFKGYHLIIGETAQNRKHCIVGFNGKPAWDPSRDRNLNSLLREPFYGIIHKILL